MVSLLASVFMTSIRIIQFPPKKNKFYPFSTPFISYATYMKKHQNEVQKSKNCRYITSTILPLGNPPPNAKSSVKQPLGKVSLEKENTITEIILWNIRNKCSLFGFYNYSLLSCCWSTWRPKKISNIEFHLLSFLSRTFCLLFILSFIRKKGSYTRAPPALPNLVTLPFPNELFISFIAASNAFCWKIFKPVIKSSRVNKKKVSAY